MTTSRFNRQLGIINQSELEDLPITVIGVGGIGSATVFTLAKMGAKNITIFDDDVLEEHNISNQTYPHSAVGKPKVEAMAEMVEYMEGVEIISNNRKYDGCLSEVVICGVDSMASREEIFKYLNPNYNKFYIDARMGGEQLTVYSIDMDDVSDVEFYKTTLYSDNESMPIPCTERAIIYNTMGIASHIAAIVKKRIMKDSYFRQIIYDFKTGEYLRL